MERNSEKYAGLEELEVLKIAKNYNNSLCKKVERSFSKEKNTVDFGAGIGTFAKSLQGRGYKDISCIEIDDDQRNQISNTGFKAFKSIDELPEKSVSQIYSFNVLEHIENDQEVINSLYQSMVDSGLFYVYLPAFNILYSAFDKKIGHFRRYTKKDIVEKLQKAGFEIKFAKYTDSLGFLMALAYKFIDKSGTINKDSVAVYDKFIYPLSQFLDVIFSPFFGKNVEVLAIKNK